MGGRIYSYNILQSNIRICYGECDRKPTRHVEGGPSKFDYYVKIIEKRQNKTNKDAL